ncbi:MAG: ATP-binding protein [Rikenellaceae bacterium]
MDTDFTSRITRQSHLFVALLILLWGLLSCFIFIQYSNEKRHLEQMLDTRLQVFNSLILGNIDENIALDTLIREYLDNREGLSAAVITDGRISGKYASSQGNASKDVDAILSLHASSIEDGGSRDIILNDYIYSMARSGDSVICSSLPCSIKIIDTIIPWNGSFIIVIIVSIIISVIGFISARLFRLLEIADKNINHQQAVAIREEQDKIRLKRQLTNNINHEIKTPICSIMGYLEMIINNEELEMERCRNFVEKSYSQAERLRSLMADLSTITRMDDAQGMIDREDISLGDLITNLIDDVIPQTDKQNIIIITNIESKLQIKGNYTLLYSIFRNLIDNAIAYSGGRHIWVELCEESDKFYTFSIRDNGIGVEAHHIPYLFERFYRVDKGRSRKLGGTGLGLSIVKNAVNFHGGTISARIWDMGGLEFRFNLEK